MIVRISIVTAVIFILVSCAHKLAQVVSPIDDYAYSLPALVDKVNSNSIQSKWIQAKAQISLDGGDFFSTGTVHIKSCRDSLLWISVSKLGIEIGRGLVRADSAFITNNWENTYWKGSLKEIGLKYNVPAGLSDIQQVVFPALQNSNQYLMEKKSPGFELLQPGQPSKKYSISSGPNALIQSIDLSSGGADLNVNYQDYQKQDGYWFPFVHNHQFTQSNEIRVTKMKFSQITASAFPLSTPFQIPSDYTLIK